MNFPKKISYGKYPLSRIITIYEIISADYVCGAQLNNYLHTHQDAWEIAYCIQGEIQFFKDGVCTLLRPGDIAFACPGVSHDALTRDPRGIAFYISFTCSDEHIKLLRDSVVAVTEQQRQLFQQMIEELRQAFVLQEGQLRIFQFIPSKDSPVGAEQLVCCYLEQVIISILREITMQDGRLVKSKHFVKAVENYITENINTYVRDHLSEPLSVEQIANVFHYSRARLSTLYKASTGIGLNEFISQERMTCAKALLLKPGRTVAQVAEAAGFTSQQYFSRKFMQMVGCSPSQYVKDFTASVKQGAVSPSQGGSEETPI